jgi:GrpB-like predicted nucleotidyltransferase (UPF0157 family)
MKVVIVDYRPEWPGMFNSEQALLADALAHADPVIEHVGSTSVPGLAAKPVIDILIGLHDFGIADSMVPAIVSLGYVYVSKYEDVMPYRRFFTRTIDGVRSHNLHMVGIGGEFWKRHLLFRDWLRTHPDDLDGYAELKRSLAEREWRNVNEYADAKTEFIRRIEHIAGAGDDPQIS